MKIVKIPLEGLINILIELYDDGADFIDITNQVTGDGSVDIIKIIVKPEYILDIDEADIKKRFTQSQRLSEDDINELI